MSDNTSIPRSEYPRPQFRRDGWLNLNGTWHFGTGPSDGCVFPDEITVPFCPESRLSGIGNTDFMDEVRYRRSFVLPDEAAGKRVFINFGAVDYECEVLINGKRAGTHRGGYSSFSFEITALVTEGANTVTVLVKDDVKSGRQPSGKQSKTRGSEGVFYTRTTGIWQTVWLEWTNEQRIKDVRLTPDGINGTLLIEAQLDGDTSGCTLKASASFEGKIACEKKVKADGGRASVMLSFDDPVRWEAGKGNLYDLTLTLEKDGETVDRVESYFGLRSVSIENNRFYLNGKPLFQRLVLDQGFYPDGIYTAPSDEELKGDIQRSMTMGFNGARLHQKVFEQRFLYWADRLGYMVWGEMASWGIDPKEPETPGIFLPEWLEVMKRDYNSPALIGWCPWNEVWGESGNGARDSMMRLTYLVTKAADPTRPCIDASGGYHARTDIYDTHDYEQDPLVFRKRYVPGGPLYDGPGNPEYETREPRFLSEYGGIAWNPDGEGWGYGTGPASEEEFIERYRGLTDAILDDPDFLGFCYTQLTDIEQERNGLYYYDRRPKFDPDRIKKITERRAAAEAEDF